MAVKNILASRNLFGPSIHGPLGDLVQVPEAYTAAAEVALGSRISCIVTDTTETAGRIIRWLKERHLGRATFFPLESMHPSTYGGEEQKAAGEKGICGIASDLITCHDRYRDLLTSLLGRTLIAETLDDARRVAKKYRYRFRIVTLDGQLVNAGGSMTGGSMRKKENTFFGRKQEIRRLSREEEEGRKALETCSRKLEEQGHICDTLAGKVMKEREEWQTLKVSLASLTARREGMEKTLEDQEKAAEEEMALKKNGTWN